MTPAERRIGQIREEIQLALKFSSWGNAAPILRDQLPWLLSQLESATRSYCAKELEVTALKEKLEAMTKEMDEWKQHAATGVAIREKELAERDDARSEIAPLPWKAGEKS